MRCGAALRAEDVRVRRHPATPWVVLAGALLAVAYLYVPFPLPFVFNGRHHTFWRAATRVALPAIAAGYLASRLPSRRTCACRSCGTLAPIRQ